MTEPSKTPQVYGIGVRKSSDPLPDKDPISRVLRKQEVNASEVQEFDDGFSSFSPIDSGQKLVEPTYLAADLAHLVQVNAILPSLIEAMEVNIDGTGHELIPHYPVEEFKEESDATEEDTDREQAELASL